MASCGDSLTEILAPRFKNVHISKKRSVDSPFSYLLHKLVYKDKKL